MALENDCPAQRTAKLRCCAAVLTTMSALEPSSALRKATLSNPSMPEVDAMRCAPGRAKRLACASTSYSTFRVTAPEAELIVTTPRQFPQPPVCGPCCSSSARFHSSTPFAQPRVLPMISVRTNHFRLSAKLAAHSPPEHSVKYASFSGWASCTSVCADTSPP